MEMGIAGKNHKKFHGLFIFTLTAGFFLCHGDVFSAMIPIKRIVLPNQLVVLISEEHSLPMVTCTMLVDAGSWRDPSGQEGLANLTMGGLSLGAAGLSAVEINHQLDFIGSSLDSACGRDFAVISLTTLKKNLEEGFSLFLDIFTRPEFPEKEVERTVNIIAGRIQSGKDDPGQVVEKKFRQGVYIKSPYAHPLEGTQTSLQTLTRKSVVEFHNTFYRPNNTIFSIVGDITDQEVRNLILPQLERLEEEKIPDTPTDSVYTGHRVILKVDMAITQANIILGHKGIERANPDHYTTSVMNHILGGGLGSRLMKRIRIAEGLAYSVNSSFVIARRPDLFMVSLQTKNESAGKAVSAILEEIQKMQEVPVSKEELDTAKKYLIGSFPLRFTTQSGLAAFIVQLEYFDLGMDYPDRYAGLIDSVSRQMVLQAAITYLHPENSVLCVTGNLEEVKGLEESFSPKESTETSAVE